MGTEHEFSEEGYGIH